MSDQPKQKSMAELHRIVEEDAARLTRIGKVWSYLSDAEQEALAVEAERLAGDEARAEADA